VLDEFQRGLQLAATPEREPTLSIHHPAADDDAASAFTSTGDPFEDLKTLNIHQVAQALEAESPRAIAVLLSRLPAERSAEILSTLPDARRDATVREMNQDRSTPDALADRMAAAVVSRAAQLPASPPKRADRVERLAAVLRAVPKDQRRTMLTAIREQDEATADAILQKLYTFDDLRGLPDRRIQMLLTEVDLTLLATALAGTGADLADKIMNNLSRRARGSLQEEMQFRAEAPAKEVEAARNQIAAVIAKIDQEE
jgi:flagellar motor switch protein FliG